MEDIKSDILTVAFDCSLEDESALCVIKKTRRTYCDVKGRIRRTSRYIISSFD